MGSFPGYFPVWIMVIFSCGTLEKSALNQKMRYQGSFDCSPISHEPTRNQETFAEAEVSRIRCARDRWAIYGEELHFTRMLFQDRECQTPLGTIKFVSPLKEESNGYSFQNPSCHLIRKSPAWLGEGEGRCMLNQLKLNRPLSLSHLSRCSRYIPSVCQRDAREAVMAEDADNGAKEPFDQIVFVRERCVRYDDS